MAFFLDFAVYLLDTQGAVPESKSMNTNTTQGVEIKAEVVRKLEQMTVEQLAELFDYTDRMTDQDEVPTVRGWIMDALEAKRPEAFTAWMENYGKTASEAFNV